MDLKQCRDKKEYIDIHWADNSAQRTIDAFPNEEIYTVASGITPSGYIHIGNFREVITTEIVRRALENKGKNTHFIYSWDSYDAFRKVPKDVPVDWEKYLRMPVGKVPNPFNSKQETYAEHFMQLFEQEIKPFNFPVDFQKQVELQTSGIYADSIKEVLNKKHIVIEELNTYRGEDQQLNEDWWPIDIYDDETKKDTTEVLFYDSEYTIIYRCKKTNKEKSVNFKDDPRVKLRWKADWPMRWNYFKVNYEAAGKDHGTYGSSFTVGDEIVKKLFNRQPPVHSTYDFVLVKGQGGKISSSKGGALRVKDVLEVYTPEMVLFLFAGTRPNSEIHISFDVDVIKLYEDFDALERLYFGLEIEKNEKQRLNKMRQYELSLVNGVSIPSSLPFQPQFRHLTVIAQANDFEYVKVEEYYKDKIHTEFDRNRLQERFNCAKYWLKEYADDDFVFSIKKQLGRITTKQEVVLTYLREIIDVAQESGVEYVEYFKTSQEKIGMSTKEFFSLSYELLIGKGKGPKLSEFLFENKEKFKELLMSEYSIDDTSFKDMEGEDVKGKELTDFSKLNLQVGRVINTKQHPHSDTLLVLQVDITKSAEMQKYENDKMKNDKVNKRDEDMASEIRTVIFSIENGYSIEELKDKKMIFLTNLKYSNFKGVSSEAMAIACENEDKQCGVIESNLEVGSHLQCSTSSITEVANCEEYIKKEEFLKMNFKGKNGKLYFNDIQIKDVQIDREIEGRII